MSMWLGASWEGAIFSLEVAIFQVLVTFLLPRGWFINHLEMFCNWRANAFLRAVASTLIPKPKPHHQERAWEAASPRCPKPSIWEVNVLPSAPTGEWTHHKMPVSPVSEASGCLSTVPRAGAVGGWVGRGRVRRVLEAAHSLFKESSWAFKLIYLIDHPRPSVFSRAAVKTSFPCWEINFPHLVEVALQNIWLRGLHSVRYFLNDVPLDTSRRGLD